MKIERRANCCFISHSGVAIFADRLSNAVYRFRVNKRVHDIEAKETWITVAELECSKADFKKIADLIGELVQ